MRADVDAARRWRGYRRLFGYAAPYRRGWAGIAAATLASTALTLLQPWPVKVLVDHVLGAAPSTGPLAAALRHLPFAATPEGLLAWVVGAGLLVFLATSAAEAILAMQWTRIGRRMVYQVSRDLFARAQRRSLRSYGTQSVGDAMGRAAVDAWCVHTVVDTLLFAPGHAMLTAAAIVVVMFRLDPWLTGLALLVAPPMAAAAWAFGRPLRQAAHDRRDVETRIQAHVHQTLSGVSVVQAFTREDEEQRRFQQLASMAIRAHQRTALVGSLYGLGSGLLTTLGTAAVMWVAAMRVLDGQLTVGTTLVFLAYLGSLQWQLTVFAQTYTALQTAGASVDRVMDVFDGDDGVPEAPGATPLHEVRGDVVLENVTFGYRSGEPILRGVSLTARRGDVIAIVGSTGAGKSTLAGLIPRFYDPDAGRVLIDGRDVRDVQLASLRDRIAIVPQESFLFPVTVAENIGLGRADASRRDIEEAARAANAHAFITALPGGYDAVVGERGATLSGGERQRIAIARALLKDAPILLLDEPTSALDPETEHAVVEALERLMRGRTTFIIAHRLSTIRNATGILVLEQGEVVEHGRPATLLALGGRYSRLYALQHAAPAGTAA
jgi:ATP-binding cassette subfamily B protein/subfamily B ATP-binding cassette protein MsbA